MLTELSYVVCNIWGIKFGWMVAELLIWHVFHHDLQRHPDCCPEPFQRLLRTIPEITEDIYCTICFELTAEVWKHCLWTNCAWSYCRYKRRGGGLPIFGHVTWLAFTSISEVKEWGGHSSCGPTPHTFPMPLRAWTLDSSRKTCKHPQGGISVCTRHTSLGDMRAEERNVPHQRWKSAVCIFQSL